YREAQEKSLGDLQKEAEKKRMSKSDRRCGSIDNKSICVNDSTVDRLLYGDAYAQLVIMEANHREAHGDAAGFCAAHKKLEEAAAKGDLKSDATYAAVIDAVKTA